jgi:hypothetical protein
MSRRRLEEERNVVMTEMDEGACLLGGPRETGNVEQQKGVDVWISVT